MSMMGMVQADQRARNTQIQNQNKQVSKQNRNRRDVQIDQYAKQNRAVNQQKTNMQKASQASMRTLHKTMEEVMSESVPNWQHNSGKDKKGRGRGKGQMRAAKQRLRHIKNKYGVGKKSKEEKLDEWLALQEMPWVERHYRRSPQEISNRVSHKDASEAARRRENPESEKDKKKREHPNVTAAQLANSGTPYVQSPSEPTQPENEKKDGPMIPNYGKSYSSPTTPAYKNVMKGEPLKRKRQVESYTMWLKLQEGRQARKRAERKAARDAAALQKERDKGQMVHVPGKGRSSDKETPTGRPGSKIDVQRRPPSAAGTVEATPSPSGKLAVRDKKTPLSMQKADDAGVISRKYARHDARRKREDKEQRRKQKERQASRARWARGAKDAVKTGADFVYNTASSVNQTRGKHSPGQVSGPKYQGDEVT